MRLQNFDYVYPRCGCNEILITTYILCQEVEETVDHLLVAYQFATRIWSHFASMFNIPNIAEGDLVFMGEITFKFTWTWEPSY